MGCVAVGASREEFTAGAKALRQNAWHVQESKEASGLLGGRLGRAFGVPERLGLLLNEMEATGGS